MINLVELIQVNLGYPALHKVDPNTRDINEKEKSFGTNSLAQAAIPAVLCGLYNYILQPGADNIALLPKDVKWLPLFFGDSLPEMTKRIADYAGTPAASAKAEMEHIAEEAVRLLKEQSILEEDSEALHHFSAQHKNNTLLYLPEILRTGELLGNNTLDDSTHKMEGPISGLMHKIEKHFGGDGRK